MIVITSKQLPTVKSIANKKNHKSPLTYLIFNKEKLLNFLKLSYFSTSANKDWQILLKIIINIPKFMPMSIENNTQYVQNTSFQSHVIKLSIFRLIVES